MIDNYLARGGTSVRKVIIDTLVSVDVDAYRRAAGLGEGGAAYSVAQPAGGMIDECLTAPYQLRSAAGDASLTVSGTVND